MCMKYFNLLNAVIWNEHKVESIIFFVAISVITSTGFHAEVGSGAALGFPSPEMF